MPPLTTWQRTGSTILPNRDETYSTVVRDPAGGWRAYSHRVAGPAAGTIWVAFSSDGLSWKNDTDVFDPGPAGAWDAGAVGVPFVWYEAGRKRPWRMLYRGTPKPPMLSEIGLATSADGLLWERKDSTGEPLIMPVIAHSESWETGKYLDFGSLIKVGSTYYLHYDTLGADRMTGIATSSDLVNWNKDSGNPLYRSSLGPDVGGAVTDGDHGRFCPDIVRWDDGGATRYVMFVPHYLPQQLNPPAKFYSDIEVYTSPSPVFRRSERTYVGVVTFIGDTSQGVFDTPHIVCDTIERDVTSQSTVRMEVGVAELLNPIAWHEEQLVWHM